MDGDNDLRRHRLDDMARKRAKPSARYDVHRRGPSVHPLLVAMSPINRKGEGSWVAHLWDSDDEMRRHRLQGMLSVVAAGPLCLAAASHVKKKKVGGVGCHSPLRCSVLVGVVCNCPSAVACHIAYSDVTPTYYVKKRGERERGHSPELMWTVTTMLSSLSG